MVPCNQRLQASSVETIIASNSRTAPGLAWFLLWRAWAENDFRTKWVSVVALETRRSLRDAFDEADCVTWNLLRRSPKRIIKLAGITGTRPIYHNNEHFAQQVVYTGRSKDQKRITIATYKAKKPCKVGEALKLRWQVRQFIKNH